MSSVSSINISKVSTALGSNIINGNEQAQQSNRSGIGNTQSSENLAKISRAVAETSSDTLKGSDDKNIQMEKRAEGGFKGENSADDDNQNESPKEEKEIKFKRKI